MAQVTGTHTSGVHATHGGSTVVAGGLHAAKERAGVHGGPNPAAGGASSHPISAANFQAQLG
ncbi:MAG TPA: hypothetical protein VFX30_14210 [bacterium]|nr:hypothetical protein [bacterium]